MPDINDLMPTTPDLNRERLEQLKALMPDLFTNDGRLDPEELKRLVAPESVSDSEKFEFRWFGKAAAKRRAFTPTTGTLQYDAARSVNPGAADGNMIIEGENLEVLKCLLSAYREKIKCIYIDPPYNTGKDFVYSDNYTEERRAYWEQTGATEEGVKVDTNPETSGRFHSNWLNMLYPRLLAARQLLREDGVIFISIDDNEVHNLRKLMDEVFGQDNFIENFIWKKSYGGGAKEKHAVTQHEYILLYALDINNVDDFWLPSDPEAEEKYYKFQDNRGPYRIKPLEATKSMDERANLVFPVPAPNGGEIWPKRQWWWSKDRVMKALSEDMLVFVENNGETRVSYKQYLYNEDGTKRGRKPFSILDGFYTQTATANLRGLFDDNVVLQFPKPVDLLKELIGVGTSPDNDIILDFFAGSGTTGQAVMELNREDGGNRKFILVQLPELTDAKSEAFKAGYRRISEITIERSKRVIARIEQEQAKAESGQQDMFTGERKPCKPGFKVYRMVKSHFPRVEFQPDPDQSAAENLAAFKRYIAEKESQLYSLFNEPDIFDEVMLKNGFMLHYSRTPQAEFTANTVYFVSDGRKEALVCLDTLLKDETIARLKDERDRLFICLECAVDTTKKWNLKHLLGDKLVAF